MTNSNFHTKYQLKKFNFERNEIKEIELLYHLKNIYQVSDKFQLVHNQALMEE